MSDIDNLIARMTAQTLRLEAIIHAAMEYAGSHPAERKTIYSIIDSMMPTINEITRLADAYPTIPLVEQIDRLILAISPQLFQLRQYLPDDAQ
jgi:hypothetical protein